jgi:outer membrane immunogenic protein
MKLLLLAATALTALSVSAFAADLPKRSAPAAAPAPVFSWAGAYVGAHGGFASFKPRHVDVLDASYNANPTVDGGVFGVMGGYNLQSGNIVYGGEGDFGFGTHSKQTNGAINDYTKFAMPMNGHLRARLGYALGQTLFFVAGGVSFAQFKNDDIDANYGSFSQARMGWTIGAGVEHAVTKNWIVRAEYLYDRFGSKTSNISYSAVVTVEERPYDVRLKPDMHTVRAALIYKF